MSSAFQTEIEIKATPEEVFAHFIKPELLVRWMGDFARLEAKAGGLFSVDINGVLIRGQYVRLDPPRRIEIAWGEQGNDTMPPGATQLVIEIRPHNSGSLLSLTHKGLSADEQKKHALGWPHFLARLTLAASGQDPGSDPWAKNPPGGRLS